MPRTLTDTRCRILKAAEDVVISDGVSKLTLESAAQAAGVSKGGVLYHFPTRAALVGAMVERYVVSFEAELEELGGYGGGAGDFTRAYLRATLSPLDADDRALRLGAALLASVASDPDLLAPLRLRFAAWQKAIERDGLPPEVASVIRLAADGIWLTDLFALAPVSGALRRRVGDHLVALTLAGDAPTQSTAR